VTADAIAAELARRAQPTPPEAKEPPNYGGLAARTAIKGVTGAVLGLPALAQDAVTQSILNPMYMGQNYLADKANETFGTNIPHARLIPSALKAVNQGGEYLADVAGTPKPQTPGQALAVDLGSAGVSALGPGGWGRLLTRAAPAGSAMAEAGSRLAATPILDAASGITGEAASKAVEGKNGTPGQQMVAGVAGGVLPYFAAAAGRRVITPFPSQLSAEDRQLAGVLRDAGVPLSAGQEVGNRGLQFIENQAAKLPGGDFLSPSPTANQRPAFTQAVLRRAGINAEAATPDVLSDAHTRIGGEIGNITGSHTVHFDPQYSQDIYATAANYGRNLTTDQKQIVGSYLTDLGQTARLSGEQYQTIRSQLGRRIRAENGPNGDKEFQQALVGIQSALDDAAERSMVRAGAADEVQALRQARQQYANLLTIENAVARSGEAGARGEINASSLAAATKAAVGKQQYARGIGDMTNTARAGDSFIRPLPDPSTAQRMALPAYGASIAGGYQYAGPYGAAAMAALPAVSGALVNSRLAQAYFRNQLLPEAQRLPLGAIPGLLGN
jgi:hypothetical protein